MIGDDKGLTTFVCLLNTYRFHRVPRDDAIIALISLKRLSSE